MSFKSKTSKILVFILVLPIFFITTMVFSQSRVVGNYILLGQSCALSGQAEALGQELRDGALVYFNNINKTGGIRGKKIKLISYDDAYDPMKCILNTRKLINKDKVFLLFGYVGTPTTKAIVNILNETEIPLFGPFTGAGFLRDTNFNIFNVRTTYDRETKELVERFVKDKGYKRIACFYQNDSYGKIGLNGVEKALFELGLKLSGKACYERNTIAVKSAAAKMKLINPEAIIMIGAYSPCAEFIEFSKKIGLTSNFANISFVGTDKLIEHLGNEGEGVYISQVMPSPLDPSVKVVSECRNLLGHDPTYGELEGFVNAKILVHVLSSIKGEITRKKFVQAIESVSNYDVGGFIVDYSKDDHQGIDKVFLTKISQGKAVAIEKV